MKSPSHPGVIAAISSGILFLLPRCGFTAPASTAPAKATSKSSQSVAALIRRITPQAASNFQVGQLPAGGPERFEIRAVGGKIALLGSTPVAQASAYGWYLKHVANAHLSWSGDQTRLPARLPAPTAPIEILSPYAKRHAFNYCTLSYTAPYWDWNRWQREIDFMALNGFNQVLVTAGMEKVWQLTLRELGYPEAKIREFIPSPTYAAWWNMGNLEGTGGPLSNTAIENETRLGIQIVNRLRELGMTPVLNGFVGLLPHDIGEYVPDLAPEMIPQGTWGDGVYIRPAVLNPTKSQFNRVAAIYYKHLHQVYGGPTTVYGGDLFHEGGKQENTDLEKAGQAVQSAMQVASPGSVWSLQAWQSNPSDKLLAGLDPSKTEVLRLVPDMRNDPIGGRTYNGHPWLWSETANFGGKIGIHGGLPLLANLPNSLLRPQKNIGKVIGVGTLSEAIEQNPLYYDLFFDNLWRSQNIDLNSWLDGYQRRRFGQTNAKARQGLQLLLESRIFEPNAYQQGPTESILCARPARGVRKAYNNGSGNVYYDRTLILDAAQALLSAAPQLGKQETYRYDLVDWTRQSIVELARPMLDEAMAAYDRKDLAAFNQAANRYLDLIRDTDRLLASDRHFLLGTWLEAAKTKGTTPAEKALNEKSARALITTWYGKHGSLNDYSHRQWSGMMQDYYLPRWQAFFDDYRTSLEGKLPTDQLKDWYVKRRFKVDNTFAEQTKTYPTQAKGDSIAIATELLAKYAPISAEYARLEKMTKELPWKLAPGVTELAFDINAIVSAAGTYQARFEYRQGKNALQIQSVSLFEGEKKVAEDVHEGWTGNENKQNIFTLVLPRYRTGLETYTLRATVKGAAGNDSSGIVRFMKVK